MRFLLTIILKGAFWLLITPLCLAQSSPSSLFLTDNTYLIAQADGDDAYDPFADYSEFDEASEEEADINFFKNGRFLNVGLFAGLRTFTSNMGRVYKTNSSYGVFISYFFDLRFALQTSYRTGNHAFSVPSSKGSFSGNASISAISFNLKYYFNTQNVTRGLAELNPYVIGGFSQYTRKFVITQDIGNFPQDGGSSVDIGGGIEIPMLRNKMYFGVEGAFHLVNFPDESLELPVYNNGNKVKSGVRPNGDVLTILGLLGVNF